MFCYVICALLALTPIRVSAKAFPWALPEPTFVIPDVDSLSPAPTRAPDARRLELFRRAPVVEDDTCGWVSGVSTSSITCRNSNYACATNTYYGNHGCCDPQSLSACSIPTTCIPATQMTSSCTNAACSSDNYIAKCTGGSATECYTYTYMYESTSMIEWGCATEAMDLTVLRSYSGMSPTTTTHSDLAASQTGSVSSTSAPAPTEAQVIVNEKKSNNLGAIVGGAVGGVVALGAVAFAIVYLILRDRRRKRELKAATVTQQHTTWPTEQAPGVTEYDPHGFRAPEGVYAEQNYKGWNAAGMGPSVERDCGGHPVLYGVVETEGRPVHEAPDGIPR